MSNSDLQDEMEAGSSSTGFSSDPWSGPLLRIQSPLFNHQVGNSNNQELLPVDESIEKEPEIWKKTEDVKVEHQNFLDKLGLAEKQAMNARFIDPSVAASVQNHSMLGEPTQEDDGTQTAGFSGNAIPWRKKDPSVNPLEERKILFDSFHRTGGEVPKSPPKVDEDVNQGASSRSPYYTKRNVKLNEVVDIKHAVATVVNPYGNIVPKVDTGLNQLKKQQKFTSGGVPIPENKAKHHPLTIGSRLPTNFNGQVNYDLFKADRAARIAELTARLYPERRKTRNPIYVPAQHKTKISAGGVTFDQRSFFNAQQRSHYNNIHKVPNNKKPPTSYNQHQGGHQLTVLRAPVSNAPSSSSVRQDMFGYQTNDQNRFIQDQGQASNNKQQQIRRLKPSQLMPLHIPGPKYDNIYIGPYSGSESDRDDEDNMDRQVKSRKR